MKAIEQKISLADGREITIETGKLARQADGSVVVRMGNTMILATAVSLKEAKEGIDFLPLSVDYQEKFASAGKIPGGFLKREGKLSDHEVLVSRLVDRAIRPLFPDDYGFETQVNIYLISADADALPDSLAALAASAALTVSDINFNGPISEARVIKVGEDYIINPTPAQIENAELNLIVAASIENIMMVEGEMKEVSEDDMLGALKAAHEAIKDQCKAQLELMEKAGKSEKREFAGFDEDEDLKKLIFDAVYDKFYTVASSGIANKNKRKEGFSEITNEFLDSLPEDHEYDEFKIKRYLKKAQKKAARSAVLDTNKRLDGRDLEEVRPIWSEVNYLPSAHGSAVFTRGETQSLTSVTLGTKLDEQMIDGAMHQGYNKFILHYNFPAFSTGEVRPNRGPGRREVGHGNLAFRALSEVIPPDVDNPYTIRVVSDILESNGSSSMATVCAGSLALMDAGIKIKAPVSGIAMGMISDPETGKYAILSDILGDEDHLGDMDFKVTGTANGITACQMDIKVDGLSYDVLKEALEQANRGRLHILGEMNKTLAAPREDYKPHAPRSITIKIEKEMIGAVIGPGGKIIQEIQKETGSTIIIEEVDNKGVVNVFANDQKSTDAALARIKAIIAVPEVGEVYDGVVKSIMPFGAFIEFMKGKEGLLHISEITWERLESMDGVLEEGEEVKIKLIDVDKKSGKFRLSRKVLLPKPEGYQSRPKGNDRTDNKRKPR
ncbi:polyribonucleotide nucleotidyltransferase [Chondrinema litorale]|uniref:polyribonucleotide nucleotidyltransferase n=1 Tax=Chondrinema litorale TaxID=2994555 RepID=UPI002544A474|nr:polyribonucleotide nucleotidyltransferase [Chondrinema litorale]UZR92972.1 polyribonucleotide nucleotidyltransferase [Chondrinema litorale]